MILTHEQAELLRSIRPKINLLQVSTDNLRTETSKGCEHDGKREDCPICCLYFIMVDADEALQRFAVDLDAYLERGPVKTGI